MQLSLLDLVWWGLVLVTLDATQITLTLDEWIGART
jgi:hypothetical protein